MNAPIAISLSVPSTVRALCMSLEQEGYEAWIVGGCVRDTLMGRTPHDYDVATNASPEEVTRICTSPGVKVEPTGIQHGTVTVVVQNPCYPMNAPACIEVTTFRGDGEYTDGRRPDSVVFVKTIEEDLARRDFTINAMAFRPAYSRFVYPFGGLSDIRVKRIKAVGDARERFMEDGLRVMRACRFSAQLGFFIAKDTKEAMCQTPVREKCLGVAVERLEAEFRKIMVHANVHHGLEAMEEAGLLAGLLPNVKTTEKTREAVFSMLGEGDESTYRVRLAALLYHFGGAQASSMLEKLRVSTATRLSVINMISGFWAVPAAWGVNGEGGRWWLARVGKPDAKGAIALAGRFGWAIFARQAAEELAKNPPLAVGDLALNGTQVAEVLGVRPGKAIGEALRYLLAEVIKNPEMNKAHLLTMLLMKGYK